MIIIVLSTVSINVSHSAIKIELFALYEESISIIFLTNAAFLNSSSNFTPYFTSSIFRESARNI